MQALEIKFALLPWVEKLMLCWRLLYKLSKEQAEGNYSGQYSLGYWGASSLCFVDSSNGQALLGFEYH